LQPTLYKYTPVNTDEHMTRLRRLLAGQLYFSSPLHFNDPFEMSPLLVPPTRDEMEKAFKLIGWEPDQMERAVRRRFVADVEHALAGQSKPAVSREWLESIGVACFSTIGDDLLMWAHYATNHVGLCLGFDSKYGPFSSARPVEYSSERPRIPAVRVLQTDELLVRNVLLRKSEHWGYEKEWRAVKRPIRQDELDYYSQLVNEDHLKADEIADVLASEGGPGHYEFNPLAIRRVLLGARMPNDKKKEVIDLLRSQCPHVKIFEMQLDPRYFRLYMTKAR
jgi:hypothetical protein